MTQPLPTSEPTSVTAGDLIQWTRAFVDYPSTDGWVLSYRLLLPTAVEASVTVDGTGWLVSFDPTDTASIVARTTARLVGYAEKTGDRKSVFDGYVTLYPNPATVTASDLETHETRCLAVIEAAIERDLPTHMTSYQIDGKQVSKPTPLQLLQLRDKYRTLVWRQRNPGKSFKSHAVRFANA